ncbi:hypothetical protein MKZ38_005850 [Zalerion maritima]|uniref:Uncharacterized protein n=1 Tax=Zalerion maritima TaxID=339359 RepID=A0AAD5WQ39_9PEZI|nr:hypothetical protein MKZ38_005850 [Zalerion maritima]
MSAPQEFSNPKDLEGKVHGAKPRPGLYLSNQVYLPNHSSELDLTLADGFDESVHASARRRSLAQPEEKHEVHLGAAYQDRDRNPVAIEEPQEGKQTSSLRRDPAKRTHVGEKSRKMKCSAMSLLSGGLALAAVVHATPEPTPAPELPAGGAAEVLERRASSLVTTSYYSLVSTEIPKDKYSIGMGLQKADTNSYYWLYCINDAFSVSSSASSIVYGGCGSDDLYTSCNGKTASGIDGGEILCDLDCVTHKVYQDLDATTYTTFIGCGRGTSTMNLLRTSTSAGDSADTTATDEATATGDGETTGAAETTGVNEDAGVLTRPHVGMVIAGVVAGVGAMVL